MAHTAFDGSQMPQHFHISPIALQRHADAACVYVWLPDISASPSIFRLYRT